MTEIDPTNLIDQTLIARTGGSPHDAFRSWRHHDPVHGNPPNPDYRCDNPDLPMERGFWVDATSHLSRSLASLVTIH